MSKARRQETSPATAGATANRPASVAAVSRLRKCIAVSPCPATTAVGSVEGPALRHDAPHEAVEHRHGERGIAVARAPDHALGDQLAARGPERGDLAFEQGRHVAGTMRAGAELRHRAQVALLRRRQAVEAYAEEALVERGRRGDRCGLD